MYLYFNREGILKEIVNDKPLRQGSVNVNKIYIFVEELNTNIPQNIFVNYRLPDGTKIPEFEQQFLAIPTSNYMEIPYNPKRDLKFFKYYEKYPMYEIPLNAEIEDVEYNALSQYGSVALTLRVDSLFTLGLIVFDVEESSDGEPEIHWDEYISLAQFNYLLSLLSTYYTKEQAEEYIELYVNSYSYNQAYIDTALAGKVDKRTTEGQKLYAHFGDVQGEETYSSFADPNTIVKRDSHGDVIVPTTTNNANAAVSQYALSTGLTTKQDKLVSGTNIKTINQQSLLGSGNITIREGAGAWGEISGDIQDQADLQAEFQSVREVAEGKNKTLVLSYNATAPTSDAQAQALKKPDGTAFTDLADFNSYVSGLTLRNSIFNSQDTQFTYGNFYLISNDNIIYRSEDMASIFKVGDIILIIQTDVPDRWVSTIGTQTYGYPFSFSKLETTKVDLTNYATTGDLSIARYEIDSMLAPEYFPLNTYAVGDKVVHNHKLYTCTTAIDTPESWDATHWSQISVVSGFVDLDKEQVISGKKTFSQNIRLDSKRLAFTTNESHSIGFYSANYLSIGVPNYAILFGSGEFKAATSNTIDLGTATSQWKDLRLAGNAFVGTYGYINGTDTNYFTVRQQAGNAVLFYVSSSNFFTRNVNPITTSAYDLGSSSQKWKDIWLSGAIKGLPTMTQTDYDNMASHDADTLYFIEEE